MKIKLTLLALLLGFTLSASAQLYSEDYVIKNAAANQSGRAEMIYGVMAGVTVPKMWDKAGVIDVTNTAGYQVGMMWGVDLGGLEIVPEIWYLHDKANVTNSDNGESGDLVSRSIEVPVIFAMVLGPIRFNIGPSFSLLSNSTFKYDDQSEEDIDFGRIKSTAGYVVGLSTLLWGNIILDARYTGRFVSTEAEWNRSATHYDYRYYSFSASIGYRF